MKKKKLAGKQIYLCPIVEMFVREPIQWPREIKFAKRLWEKFPDMKFWETLKGYRTVPTLTWLLTPQELHALEQKFVKFKKDSLEIPEATSHTLGEKVGEDRTDFKPSTKSLLEFLRK